MQDESPGLLPRLHGHVVETIRLAVPVVITRAGVMAMAVVDTAMLGRTEIEQVAFYGISIAPFVVVIVAGIGLMFGTVVATSHAVGRGMLTECGAIWRRSLPYALLLGAAGFAVCQCGEALFILTGQPAEISEGGGRVIAILGIGMPGTLLYCTTAFFLEGLRRPVPAMFVMIAANLMNVLLNWLLVFGNGGFPALGAEGAAWSTAAVRLFMAAILMTYVWWMPDRDRYAVRGPIERHWWRKSRQQRKYGYAAGAGFVIEESALAAISFFAGVLGALSLAAYTVQNIAFAFVYMAGLGVAAATGVRVGIAHGAGDWSNRAMAGWTGFGLVTVMLGGIALVFLVKPDWVAVMFTDDPVLVAAAAPLIVLSAVAILSDGARVVMASALRGAAEVWSPPIIEAIAYYPVMLPLAGVLAFTLGMGVRGLVLAIIAASVVSAALLVLRFRLISRRLQPTGPAL